MATTSPTPRKDIESSPLYNHDLAPVSRERRTWTTYNYAALWVSMSVNILTYMLAASLIQGGMDWKQAVLTVFLGNTIVLAPMLLGVGLLLLGWAWKSAGGFGPMLSTPSQFRSTSDFLKFLIPALNGAVGFWSTVSLNIPDFTRFAKDEKGQAMGQAIALPLTMTFYSFIGVAVTSATVVIYGTAIWDPVQLLSRFHSPVAVVISLLAILLATLNVNIGANVVSPANDFSNLWPKRISFKLGGMITCFMGVAMMPWKLLANHRTFIFGWLGGYAAVLGPVAGIMICDYFIIRRKQLLVDDLYLRGSRYEYATGSIWMAVLAPPL